VAFSGDEYGRRTIDFVERLQRLSAFEDVKALVVGEFVWYGLPLVTSWSMPGPGEDPKALVECNTRPQEFINHYVEQNYVEKDPVLTEVRRTLATVTWHDVQMKRRLGKTERAVMNEAREFGADDGIVVPIIMKSGVGLLSACGRLPNLSPRARAALENVAIYSHQALSRAANREGRQRQQTNTPLTPREREIMTWVATGKSDDEIADILNIGRETVTTHVENAKRKLGAVHRTYAIVQALRFGEIAL